MPNTSPTKQMLYGQLKEEKCILKEEMNPFKDKNKKCHLEVALKRNPQRRVDQEGRAQHQVNLHRAAGRGNKEGNDPPINCDPHLPIPG